MIARGGPQEDMSVKTTEGAAATATMAKRIMAHDFCQQQREKQQQLQQLSGQM